LSRERAKQLGGDGTPQVLEFAPAVLGARLQMSTGAAHNLMADALDIAHRLPRLWRRVRALEVKASYARFVARRTRDLSAAAERERDAAMRQLARPTRSTEVGMRGFYVRASLLVIARLDAIVTHFARILLELGDTGTEDERRVKAVLILTNPKVACELLEQHTAWQHRWSSSCTPRGRPAWPASRAWGPSRTSGSSGTSARTPPSSSSLCST
jgi:hypothetical protein